MKWFSIIQRWKQQRYLPDNVILEETTTIKPAIWTIITILIIFIALAIWSDFAYIQETHTAFGVVQPKQRVPVTQQLANAQVARLLVNDGDIVKQGQPLIQLSKSTVQAQLKDLQLQEINLAVSAIRWQSFIDQGKTDFKSTATKLIHDQYSSFPDQQRLQALIITQQQLLDTQQQQLSDQQATVLASQKRYQQQLTQVERQQVLLENNAELLNKQLDMYKKLLKANAISRRDYISMQQQVNNAQSNLSELSSKQADINQSLIQAKAKTDELMIQIKQRALQKLADINNKLSDLRSSIIQNNNVVNALNISAPTSGIVKDISVHPGSTITADETLLNIIPLERQLIVSANIPAKEVGRVSIGDAVRIKPLNNSTKFMTMPGEVQAISSDSFTDQAGQSYYRAVISVASNKTQLGDKQPLIPGINVETYIATGKQSVLAYILRPR
jgi:HlyD family type I secretion membrane fusion protein